MANYCEYKCIVRGTKSACYAVYGSMSCLDGKWIEEEHGNNNEYEMRFEGNCKWAVDSYCTPLEDVTSFTIPLDAESAFEFGQDHWGIPQFQKSTLFNVEFLCNSADVEDYDPDWYDECGGHFEHYLKGSTENVEDKCPKQLYIKPDWLCDEESDGFNYELLEGFVSRISDKNIEKLKDIYCIYEEGNIVDSLAERISMMALSVEDWIESVNDLLKES